MFQKKYQPINNLKISKYPINEEQTSKARKIKEFQTKYKHLLSKDHQGKKYTDQEKKIIIRTYINYKLMPENFNKLQKTLLFEIANLCGISLTTLKQIKLQFGVDVDPQIHYDSTKIDETEDVQENQFLLSDNYKEVITTFIEKRARLGQPTLSSHIIELLHENYDISISKTTVWRALLRYGLKYKKIISKDKNKERNDILKLREEFCHTYFKYYTSKEYDSVFIDESYICKNHVRSKTWLPNEEKVSFFQKPSGKGQRIVIVAAINKQGFIKNSFEFWVANSNSDYHKNFNKEIFLQYFTTKVLPNLKRPSLIILDNAPYHKIFDENKFNPVYATKKELLDFLTKNQIEADIKMLRKELLQLFLQIYEPPKNLLELLAEKHGLENFNKPQKNFIFTTILSRI